MPHPSSRTVDEDGRISCVVRKLSGEASALASRGVIDHKTDDGMVS